MSLRIRRGTDAQRQQITPDEGELIFTTNTQKLYMGDGITQGGINIGQTLAGTGLVFDSITQTLQATGGGNQGGGGILSVSADLNPALGGNLNLNSRNITGTGNIVVNGNLSVAGLGANLVLNSYNISGTGNINIAGTLSVTGLGADLSISGRSIIGSGNINTTGTLGVSALSKDLVLGGYNITGTGNINTTGTLGVSALSKDLVLGGYNITGTGNINIAGTINTSGNITVSNANLNVTDIFCNDNTIGVRVNAQGTTPLSVYGIGTLGPTSGQVYMCINAAKGNIASPTTTAAGDVLGGITIQGYTATGYKAAGLIAASWDAGATLTDSSPKSTVSLVAYGGGSIVRLATFDNQGVFTAPVFKAANYATGSYPASPAKGWIIFDSTTNKFMGYNGTAWVAFTGP